MPLRLLLLLTTLLLTSPIFSQRIISEVENRSRVVPSRPNPATKTVADTIIPGIFFEECSDVLAIIEPTVGGYLAGSNGFLDTEKAQFLRYEEEPTFEVSAITAYFIEFATEIVDQDLTAKLYAVDEATGGPGGLLATSLPVRVGDVNLDNELFVPTFFEFSTPVDLTESDFFASIDFSDVYNVPSGDIGIFTTEDGCGDGFNAWERWEDGSWVAVDDTASWGQELEFFIGAVVQNNTVSSIEEFASSLEAQISPNPSAGQLNLAFQLTTASNLEFVLLDFTGRQVFTQNLGFWPVGQSNFSINLGAVPAGVYTYQLNTIQQSTFGKLVVK